MTSLAAPHPQDSKTPPGWGQAGDKKEYLMKTSDILNTAAYLIEQKGWWNGRNARGLCPILAMNIADVRDRNAAFDALLVHLGSTSTAPLTVISDWNDAEGRTAEEVIETLRACAVIEASRERETAEVA